MSSITKLPSPASPCRNICRLNARSGLCEGCLRTLEEISSWRTASSEEKWAILRLVQARSVGLSADT